MTTQNSAVALKSKNENKNAAKQQVKNAATSTRRVETRDHWEVIFNHSVVLIASYAKGIKVAEPRKGYAFGPTATEPHSRAYAKSLIWAFATNKAGKVLKDLDELAPKAAREKIAIAILTDCNLVKGDSEAIKAQLNKVEPKRERAIAEAVLTELTKPEPTTPKGGKKSQPKAEKAATKGSKAKKSTAPKGSKAKAEAKATPKGVSLTAEQKKVAKQLYTEWLNNSEVEDFDDDRTLLEVAEDVWEAMQSEPTAQQEEAMEAYLSSLYQLTVDKMKAEFDDIRKDADHDEADLAEINDEMKALKALANGTTKGGKPKAAKKSTTKGGKKSGKK